MNDSTSEENWHGGGPVRETANIQPRQPPVVTAETLQIIRQAFSLVRTDEEGWVGLGNLGNKMRSIDPGFSHVQLGFDRLPDLVEKSGIVETRRDETKHPPTVYCRLKSASKTDLQTSASQKGTSPLDNQVEALERGIVKWFDPQKGYGVIQSELEKEVWFHINSVENEDCGFPIQGDKAFFRSKPADNKRPEASIVRIQWNFGVIADFVERDSNLDFGFIQRSPAPRDGARRTDDVFFDIRDLCDCQQSNPVYGDYVVFSQVLETPKGFAARNVNRVPSKVGIVEAWDRKTRRGTIRLEGSKETVPFSGQDLFEKHLDVGNAVAFHVCNSAATPCAVCITKILQLRRFARFADEDRMLQDLEQKILEGERWEYTNSRQYHRFPILESYFFYTFERLQEEDGGKPEADRKIKLARTKEGHEKAAFNTGLVDKMYRPIFAIFSRNARQKPGESSWAYECFACKGELVRGRSYMSTFANLPERAEYFSNPKDIVYDTSLRLDAITDHIIGDRSSRLPKKLRERIPKDMTDPNEVQSFLSDFLGLAIERALERVKWNYKTAVPQYFFSQRRIQLLLPLCIDDPRKVDLAIAVERDEGAYVGRTILELDWAYSNARLIARPDSDWLTPDKIQSESDESSPTTPPGNRTMTGPQTATGGIPDVKGPKEF